MSESISVFSILYHGSIYINYSGSFEFPYILKSGCQFLQKKPASILFGIAVHL